MKRRLLLVLMTIMTGMSLSLPASAGDDADSDSDDWRDRRSQIREFFDCAFTPAAHVPLTIAEAAAATPDLSTLAFAVEQAGLLGVLADENASFTVYAPTNAAFAAIPGGILDVLLTTRNAGGELELLQTVLLYHVVAGQGRRTDPRRVFNNRVARVDTAIGQSLFFNRDREGTEINQSNLVSCQPIRLTNGTVYLIDSVLLPQF